jgi:S-adenosylmethionine:tRNA ribosyltransferase-isomerase
MKTDDFNFELPESLIAQYPPQQRGQSRLMVLDRTSGGITDSMVLDIASFIEPGTVMVFNDSKVRKARMYGICQQTGARVEFVFLAPVKKAALIEIKEFVLQGAKGPEDSLVAPAQRIPAVSRLWRAVCSKAKRQRTGRSYTFPGDIEGTIVEEIGDEKIVEFSTAIGDNYFDRYGHVPLPPYIKREDTAADEQRYQTVYAKRTGSAASPTAGLHFTPEILSSLLDKEIDIEYITLHVGLGTFLPVRTENIEDHHMHEEWFEITEDVAQKINTAKGSGRKVLAVGTTSLRALESAWYGGELHSGSFSTRIFIYPGFEFHVVDRLFTNFHTPKSTLLMLVSAFAGREEIMKAYSSAIEKRYRFFSYGDATLIL